MISAAAARANKKFSDKAKAKKRDKMKVQKKMGGGMPTAGGMSAMGRLQKARMMNKGGSMNEKRDIRKVDSVLGKNENKFKDMRPNKRKAVGRQLLKRKNKYAGGGLARGGGAAIRGTKFQGVF